MSASPNPPLKASFITAIGTPLTSDDELHVEGLKAQLEDEWSAGMDGILVAGTMGLMQLLSDQTYRDLITQSVQLTRGRGEVMAGAGDTSFARTRDRIRFLNTTGVDAVVVVTPYCIPFNQSELIEYYRALADESKKPIYLYDLPQLTRVKIDVETVIELAKHPNIKGIKCSDYPNHARQLRDVLGDRMRVVIAAPDLVDVFLRSGFIWHLDGVFAMSPHWVVEIGRNAVAGKWDVAAQYQAKLYELRHLLVRQGVFPAFTAIMNARGIPGRFCPRPMTLLPKERVERLLQEPLVVELLKSR